jgi:hypothetical protein
MQVQLDKVSRYSAWSGMTLNAAKCETSAIFHATSQPTCAARVRAALQQLHICGEPLTNIVLPTHPFKYLGVYFTLTLQWRHQVQHARTMLETMVAQLGEAPAVAEAAMCIERQSIMGKLQHTFCVAPYTQAHLDGFDQIRANAVRRAWRLPKRFPSSAVYASRANYGMGHPSATVGYVAAVVQHLFGALNDGGRLGTLARATMHAILQERAQAQPLPGPAPPAVPPAQPGSPAS